MRVYLVEQSGGWNIDEDQPCIVKVYSTKEKAEKYCKDNKDKNKAFCGCCYYDYSIQEMEVEQ